jgi:hypothetical protein
MEKLSIDIDSGIGIDQNSWYRTGIVSKPKKLVSPITTVRPASVINFRNPPELLTYKHKKSRFKLVSWSTKLGARRLVPSRIVCCLAGARQQLQNIAATSRQYGYQPGLSVV